MTPTVGRIVHYTLTDHDAQQINARRKDASANLGSIKTDALGYVAHVGNHAEAGQIFPMIITKVWGPACVNGQLMLDGNDSLWMTSATEVEHAQGVPVQGRWFWPPRI